MSGPGSPLLRRHLLSLGSVVLVHLSAPWPAIQCVFHIFLVLGLAPGFPSPLQGLAWAALGGWILEGSLRLYPHMGGTALADMIVCLLAYALLIQWPPHSKKPFWGRMAALAVLHYVLANLAVRFAAGPHAWGYAWLWETLTIPLWGSLALRLHEPIHRR